ncbi:MAG TPA: phosphatase PAP2 family protein [Roseiarcus sp.]|nr:phosphatase PAP2 family protein [Roseiarcus sp.]
MLDSRRGFIVTLALLVAVAGVFALWPNLDLDVAHLFYRDGDGFVGRGLGWTLGRDFFRVAPFIVLAAFAALYVCRRRGLAVPYAPSGRALAFLVATLAVGPGLIVNLGLKDHAHRPRPSQTRDFGEHYEFRPWYRFDGACKKNCSFVSGEASQSFWMLAPASLAPPPLRSVAIAAALAFGAVASLLRLAAGGHYLSDVLLAGLLTILIVQIGRWLAFRSGEKAT